MFTFSLIHLVHLFYLVHFVQVKDMQARVDDAQSQALKGGKKAMSKMDTRIRELESELDAENRRQGDAQKNLRKSERRIKELTYQQDEDRKNHERMQALIDQLQGKIKSYKKQIEEAEEIAALNLAKYRQAQVTITIRQPQTIILSISRPACLMPTSEPTQTSKLLQRTEQGLVAPLLDQ